MLAQEEAGMQCIRRWRTRAWAVAAAALVAGLAAAEPALGARVASVSPTGEVATVRQVVVRLVRLPWQPAGVR